MSAFVPACASPLAGSSLIWASLGLIWKAGIRTSTTIASPAANTSPLRRMTSRLHRHQRPVSAGCGSTKRFGITRTRLMRGPSMASIAGSSVIDDSTETAGISIPPKPIERMNGRGRMTMLSRPIATVEPETITDRPACVIVSTSASSVDSRCVNSSRKRKTISSA